MIIHFLFKVLFQCRKAEDKIDVKNPNVKEKGMTFLYVKRVSMMKNKGYQEASCSKVKMLYDGLGI